MPSTGGTSSGSALPDRRRGAEARLLHRIIGLHGHRCDRDGRFAPVPERTGAAEGTAAVRALSDDQIEAILQRFAALNPTTLSPSPQILKRKTSHPVTCLAISAKRYALYDLDNAGEPVFVDDHPRSAAWVSSSPRRTPMPRTPSGSMHCGGSSSFGPTADWAGGLGGSLRNCEKCWG
jgi:hypothetical protein